MTLHMRIEVRMTLDPDSWRKFQRETMALGVDYSFVYPIQQMAMSLDHIHGEINAMRALIATGMTSPSMLTQMVSIYDEKIGSLRRLLLRGAHNFDLLGISEPDALKFIQGEINDNGDLPRLHGHVDLRLRVGPWVDVTPDGDSLLFLREKTKEFMALKLLKAPVFKMMLD